MQVTLTALLFALIAGPPSEEIFVAAPVNETGAFTQGIEGPACGPDGRTAHVTEVWHRRLVQFRVDRPGLAWCRWNDCD